MTSAREAEPYRVVRAPSFYIEWDAGIAAGWLNPMVHPAQLEYFVQNVLATSPGLGRPPEDAPANARAIRFPRAPAGSEIIEIAYSVVEDDHLVTLEHIDLLP